MTGSVQYGVAHLTDYMDSHYGVGLWTPRTGIGAGSDAGLAIIDALADIRTTTGRGKLIIDPNTWLINTAPSADDYSGIEIEGSGSQASLVVYNASSGSPFSFSGNNGYTGGGVKGIGILLESGIPITNTTIGIYLAGNSSYQPDQMAFEDIYMSAIGGNSYWNNGFQMYGNARTAPQGIRVGTVKNMQIFNCHNTGFYASNAVQWSFDNIGIYTGYQGGTGNNCYIAGGGSASTNSTQIDIRGLICSGQLNLTNCSKFHISGTVGSIAAATSADYGMLDVINSGAFSGSLGAHTQVLNY